MTVDQPVPCGEARGRIRQLAQEIASGAVDPRQGANSIYGAAWESGAWDDGSECEDLADPGAAFVQLAYELARSDDDPELMAAWQKLTREAAEAYVAGRALPDWTLVPGSRYPVLGGP